MSSRTTDDGAARLREWWRGVPSVSMSLGVGEGVFHTITWRRGRLVLEDHDDVVSEAALGALGGDVCPCVDVLDAWRGAMGEVDHRHWHPDFSGERDEVTSGSGSPLVGAIGAMDLRTAKRQLEDEMRRMLAMYRSSQRAHPNVGALLPALEVEEYSRSEWKRIVRDHLDPALHDRIVLACLVHQVRLSRRHVVPFRHYVHRWAVAGAEQAVARSIDAWRHERGAGGNVVIESWPVVDRQPTVVGLLDVHGGYACAVVRPTWKVEVEARGIAVVDGCFVVDVVDAPSRADELHVLACRWERTSGTQQMAPVVNKALVWRRGSVWELHWL